MSVWAWVAGVVALAAIIFLVATGDDDRTFAGRNREAIEERSAQALVAAPHSVGAEVTLGIAVTDEDTPPEIRSLLEQVQQLLATAATQPDDQAKATLEQAQDALNAAIDATRDAADDTSNDATRIRLLTLAHLLEQIETVIQARLDQV